MNAIDDLIKILEKALSEANGPTYHESMTDEEVNELMKARTCKIDSLTAVELIKALRDANFYRRLSGAFFKRREKENKIGEMVRSAKNKDKPKAYAIAAREMGWNDGAAIFNDRLLNEYLDATGINYCLTIRGAEEMEAILEGAVTPQTIDKKAAIQMLCDKYELQSYESTYKRLQRTKKARIDAIESQGEDPSILFNVLPENWPST